VVRSVTNWPIKWSLSDVFSDEVAKFGHKNQKSGREILKSALDIENENFVIWSVLDFDENYFSKKFFFHFWKPRENKKENVIFSLLEKSLNGHWTCHIRTRGSVTDRLMVLI